MLHFTGGFAAAALSAILAFYSSFAASHGEVNDYESDVEAMYVAYYGRPGDPEGVSFWAEQLAQAAGDFSAIIEQFGTSAEYTSRFGGFNNAELIDNLYQQLLGRAVDEAGRDYYLGLLASGKATLASAALDIYNGVRNDDILIVANKVAIAHAYTDLVEDNGAAYGDAEIVEAVVLLSAVDSGSDSLEFAQAELEAIFDVSGLSDCRNFEGSFERIQSIIFDGYNCTNSACHAGDNPAGQLNLGDDVAYQNLFRVEAAANLAEPRQLIYPGEQALSFLYAKLDAGTHGTALPDGGGLAMPFGSAPLTEDHLEAMRLWIRGGAPETDDVDRVATLLGCSVGTVPQANKIDPPAAPVRGEGVQFVSGPWSVEPNSENEVCYATYYDLNQVAGALPEAALIDCAGGQYTQYDGTCFAINSQTLTQDPQSHHSIISVYTGATPVTDSSWGEWQCLNGPNQGMSCDPVQIGVSVSSGGADCGGNLYVCGTPAQRSIACAGWGADDHQFRSVGMGGAQSPISENDYYEGVYNILPTKGVIIWNSHAFNLSAEPTTIEQYNSFSFAPADARVYRNRGIFDTKDLFVANVLPYEQRTYCSTYTLPQGARLTELSSHAHQRGVLWQTWLPPQNLACTVDSGCIPNRETADYVSRIYNDPLVQKYDPPLEYDSSDASERTLKFCLSYDNGAEFPDLLKRSSVSVGSTCDNNAYCAGGLNRGEFCGNDDNVCGEGGVCDACIVKGGFTTEDEMFLLLGNYYVVPVE